MSPTITGFDSGDMITAAAIKGVAHPPGYPLYTMIGYLFSQVPIGSSIVWRLNLFSALTHAITIGIMFLVYKKLTKNTVVSAVSSLVLAFSYTFWLYSDFAEVFPLNDLFISLFLLVFLKWDEKNVRKGNNLLLLLSFLTGLSLTHHHTIILIYPLIFFYIYKKTRKFIFRDWKYLIKLVFVFLLGLLPYLYVPIAALQNPPINWENASTLNGFIRLVTRAAYGTFRAHYLSDVPIGFGRLPQINLYLEFLKSDFNYLGIILGIIGFFGLLRRKKNLALLFLGNFILSGPFFLFYANFPRNSAFSFGVVERFLIISYIFFSIFIAYGILTATVLINLLAKKINFLVRHKKVVFLLASFVFILFPESLILKNWEQLNLSNKYTGQYHAEDILSTVDKNGIVILTDDTAAFNVQYLMFVEKQRPDVLLFTPAYIRYPDKVEMIKKNFPNLYIPTSGTEYEMAMEFLEKNSQKIPIYGFNFSDPVKGKKWQPEGLLMKLYDENEKPTPEMIQRNEKIWNSYKNTTDNLLNTKGNLLLEHFRDVYNIGHYNTGIMYIEANDYDLAINHLKEAILLKPSNLQAGLALGTAYGKKGDCNTAVGIFESIIKAQPGVTEGYQDLAAVEKQCGQTDLAEKYAKLWKEKLRLRQTPLSSL